jgi:predicted outer membrane repeat protein
MKHLFKYIIPLCFLAACQPHWDMVPPGTGGGGVQQEFADNWFVTRDGSGAKTGSSWNNALSFSDFLSMISNTTTGLEDAGIHIQEGTYIVPKEAGKFLTISKDILCIRGGYSKELTYDELEDCDPVAYPTIFTGDVNGDGTPDEGDGAFAYLTGGVVRFENITFRNFYKSNSLDKETEGKIGAVFGINGPYVGTSLECNNCIFEDNASGFTGETAYQGGPCAFVSEGYFKARDCVFKNNSANSRGGAIRTASRSAVVFLDRCFFSGNSLSDTWGKAIQVSDGVLCANNCTIIGHSGNGSSINGGGGFFLSSNTIIDDASPNGTNNAAFRCESKQDRKSILINNVFGNTRTDGCGLTLNSNGATFISRGYNVFKTVTCAEGLSDPSSAEDLKKDMVLSGSVEANCWKWDISQVEADLKGFIGADEIYDAAVSFDPSAYCNIAVLGRAYATWVTPNAFALDGRGEMRGEDFQPGSYDPNLDE